MSNIFLDIDGLPLTKTVAVNPMLACNVPETSKPRRTVFFLSFYHGYEKLKENDYLLSSLASKAIYLSKNGILTFNRKLYIVIELCLFVS